MRIRTKWILYAIGSAKRPACAPSQYFGILPLCSTYLHNSKFLLNACPSNHVNFPTTPLVERVGIDCHGNHLRFSSVFNCYYLGICSTFFESLCKLCNISNIYVNSILIFLYVSNDSSSTSKRSKQVLL